MDGDSRMHAFKMIIKQSQFDRYMTIFLKTKLG